jgi:hypothetical protein
MVRTGVLIAVLILSAIILIRLTKKKALKGTHTDYRGILNHKRQKFTYPVDRQKCLESSKNLNRESIPNNLQPPDDCTKDCQRSFPQDKAGVARCQILNGCSLKLNPSDPRYQCIGACIDRYPFPIDDTYGLECAMKCPPPGVKSMEMSVSNLIKWSVPDVQPPNPIEVLCKNYCGNDNSYCFDSCLRDP